MPSIKDLPESDAEELDQETAESDKTSNEDTDSTSDIASDEGEITEVDEEDLKQRRSNCTKYMEALENTFKNLNNQLYLERCQEIDQKMEEIRNGTAIEYLQPLEELKENMEKRLEVAEILKKLKLENIRNVCEAEKQAAKQNFESERVLLWESIKADLEEKIKKLEEDRNSIDITSDLWNEQIKRKKNKKKADPYSLGKRKRPITVTGPYIVYMLPENEILEDWTEIRKALKANKQLEEYETNSPNHKVSARFADGKLLFKGDSFRKGEAAIIDDKIDSSWPAQIVSVNTSEVLLQKTDGSLIRICISDFNSGKYIIRHNVL